jgi:DNA-binding MarR family transcriptional regulator
VEEEMSKGIRAIRLIKQVMGSVKHNMGKQFENMNITGPQGMLVGTLIHYGEMKISDLSEKLGLSNSTVSGIVDRLESQGLVERTRSTEDRRVVYVNVTPEFKKNAKEHFKEFEKKFESMMSKATPEELDTILKGIATLKEVIDRQKE